MAEVKILIVGHTTADGKGADEESTVATISLIRDHDLVIVADPGVLSEQKILLDRLEEEGLTPDDVDVVFISHSHLDHYRNLGLFSRAKTLEYWGLWEGNKVVDWQPQLTPDIQIIKTPGHSDDSLTLLVKTPRGIVAVCGDVFWKENYPVKDSYATNEKQLAESRQRVLAAADWIIPGHGDMFKGGRN